MIIIYEGSAIINRFDDEIKKVFPEKPIEDDFETGIQYTNDLLNIIEMQEELSEIPFLCPFFFLLRLFIKLTRYWGWSSFFCHGFVRTGDLDQSFQANRCTQ